MMLLITVEGTLGMEGVRKWVGMWEGIGKGLGGMEGGWGSF